MNSKKKFNTWISRNFKGLSAHTLCQFLCTEMFYFNEEANNTVYAEGNGMHNQHIIPYTYY